MDYPSPLLKMVSERREAWVDANGLYVHHGWSSCVHSEGNHPGLMADYGVGRRIAPHLVNPFCQGVGLERVAKIRGLVLGSSRTG